MADTSLVGRRCAAGPGGRWGAAIITGENHDGTFTIEFDNKEITFMKEWYGVTPAELSLNDIEIWERVFPRYTADGQLRTRSDFLNTLHQIGTHESFEEIATLWETEVRALKPGEPYTESESHKRILALGVSAKRIEEIVQDTLPELFLAYVNQTRMGGRDPKEIARPVTLQDTFDALGVDVNKVDQKNRKFLEKFQKDNGITLPENVFKLFSAKGIEEAFQQSHGNNPYLDFSERAWQLYRKKPNDFLDGDYAIPCINEYQGCFQWSLVFSEGDTDARVYLRWEYEDETNEDEEERFSYSWAPTARSSAFFFWDVAQTGLAWYQETGFGGGKQVRQTDIGLVLG